MPLKTTLFLLVTQTPSSHSSWLFGLIHDLASSSLPWQRPNSLTAFTASVCQRSSRTPRNVQRAADPTAQPAKCRFFACWCLTWCSIQLLSRIPAGATCRSAPTVTKTICEDFHVCFLHKHTSNTGPCLSSQKAASWHRAKSSIHPQVVMQRCS